MDDLVQQIEGLLNGPEMEPMPCCDEAHLRLGRFIKENKARLTESDEIRLRALGIVLLLRPDPQHSSKPDEHPRFVPFMEGFDRFSEEDWAFLLQLSGLVQSQVLCSRICDVLLENSRQLRSLSAFKPYELAKKTVAIYLAYAQALAQSRSSAGQFWRLELADSIDRCVELGLSYRLEEPLKQAIPLLLSLAGEADQAGEWRWLLPFSETLVRIAESKNFRALLTETDCKTIYEWTRRMAEGFSQPGGHFHLIPDATSASARIAKVLGDPEPVKAARRQAATLVERVAQYRADKGDHLVAAVLLDQAIRYAQLSDNQTEADRLASEKVRFTQAAREAGEFEESLHEIRLTKEEWEGFLAPFRDAPALEAALESVARHPFFVLDVESIRRRIASGGFIAHEICATTLIAGIGLQVAAPGGQFSGADLAAFHHTMIHLQVMASVFLQPTIAFLTNERGLNASSFMSYLDRWGLLPPEKRSLVAHGVAQHFEGDFCSAIHILVPQFEGVMRRIFHNAGHPVIAPSQPRDGEGLTLREEAFGAFLRGVRDCLGERLYLRLDFVFTNQAGWNLRNLVAHGLLEAERFDTNASTLVLHSFLLLTHLAME